MTTTALNNSNKSKEEELIEDERIEQILKDIKLKRPRNAYIHFFLNEVNIIKSKNKDTKISFKDIRPSIDEKWQKMQESEKKEV
jgi:hypothetical protein